MRIRAETILNGFGDNVFDSNHKCWCVRLLLGTWGHFTSQRLLVSKRMRSQVLNLELEFIYSVLITLQRVTVLPHPARLKL